MLCRFYLTGMYWFVSQIKSDTLGTDGPDIKELQISGSFFSPWTGSAASLLNINDSELSGVDDINS